ncbi:Pam17-domain-containing protein [Aulographum hederae CBS 113979]|uniref:Presequence translocated-associated motor subunit PAM17 n=1 Tax=Aulographum hederae CBS 113979 TaxID=1176131 RepID=A0A6G1GM75_9PEZI|nr:Pam17-domain-containing protein [Aulographum hederae CBS 113979]
MLARTTLPLRNISITCKASQKCIPQPCIANFSTTTTLVRRPQAASATSSRPSQCRKSSLQDPNVRCVYSTSITAPSSRRAASTTTSTTTTTTTTPTSSTTSPSDSPDAVLTWNRFLALRKTRRRISLAASILSSIGFTFLGATVITNYDLDAWAKQTFGLDEIVSTGMMCVGFMGVGWLVGPVFGGAVFRVGWRRFGGQIEKKEREFYARIKKFRVDPSASSLSNPVPDYYGEKIGSVADYRRWLKDQRAFNLKRGKPML